MKHLRFVILLALAPLSWGYTFDDGNKFKGGVASYIFLECKIRKTNNFYPLNDAKLRYRKFYSVSVEKKRGYSVDAQTKGWKTLYATIEDNEIAFTDNLRYVPTITLNRTTLEIDEYRRNLSCEITDHKVIDAWLTQIRAERRI